jgi:hypothetical protein
MIKYKAKFKSNNVCVCIVDDSDQYTGWNKELVKNRADYTITNCTGMGYDVYVSNHIDKILQSVSELYKIAVVISPATEFINGNEFFNNIPEHFSLIGHILDVGESYFMIHPQCYILNLEVFNSIKKPTLGDQKYFSDFTTVKPQRSKENIHDEYTPLWVRPGTENVKYKNKATGWNLIKAILENNYSIEAFTIDQRNNKHYIYKDVNTTQWIYKRYNHCLTDHVYRKNTGSDTLPICNSIVGNLVVPAAGLNWRNTIHQKSYKKNSTIKFYDYNTKSLDWIKSQTVDLKDLNFEYHKIDILSQPEDFLKLIDYNTDYVEFSNIFAYEATAALYPLKHRLEAQNKLITEISKINQNCEIHFDQRAEEGFTDDQLYITQTASEIKINDWSQLNLPSWHTYS